MANQSNKENEELKNKWQKKTPYEHIVDLPDTYIGYLPNNTFPNRPWTKNDNPMTALQAFLKKNKNFKIDKYKSSKSMITEAMNGFVKKL